MKVIAKKVFWENDYYEVTICECAELNKVEELLQRTQPKLAHKKGSYKYWDVITERFCCELAREYLVLNAYVPFLGAEKEPGCFILNPHWKGHEGDPTHIKINFCPFCGEKIEVEIERVKK